MKTMVCILLAGMLLPVSAEKKKPVPASPVQTPEESKQVMAQQAKLIVDLHSQIAQKDLAIAQQALQITNLTIQLKLIEKAALGHDAEDARSTLQQRIDAAQQAVNQAQAAKK